MTVAERIQELNKTEDPQGLFRLVEGLLAGTVLVGRTGAPLQLNYENIQRLFEVNAGIDKERFEYLMDKASTYDVFPS